jgi:hypothetical protein
MMMGGTGAVNGREPRRDAPRLQKVAWLCKKKPGSKEPGFKVLAT